MLFALGFAVGLLLGTLARIRATKSMYDRTIVARANYAALDEGRVEAEEAYEMELLSLNESFGYSINTNKSLVADIVELQESVAAKERVIAELLLKQDIKPAQ